jgi:hypothetical protein
MSLIFPENLKKYVGVVKQNLDKLYYTYSYQNKELDIKEKKRFPYYDESSRILAYKSAIQYKIDYSVKNNLVFNVYSIENDETNGEEYVKVELNVSNKYLIVDKKDIPLIENFDWRLQNNSTYVTTYMNDIEFEKFNNYLTYIKENSNDSNIKYVYENMFNALNENNNNKEKDADKLLSSSSKRHYISFHLLKYGLEHVDFLNKNRLDNRDINIGILSKNQFNWKSQVGDAKLRINNTSGKAGVFYGKCGNYDYWEVRGKDFLGNKIYRKFSVNKHGYEGSKYMAFYFRDIVIDKSYKPHQLDNIYKQIVHQFENFQSKYNINDIEKLNIELIDDVSTSTSNNNDDDDDASIITKVDNDICKMINDDDDDFIIIEP